ncbi:MAG: MarR family transcriptional regulator [Brevinematales bacterium]|jgi:DNA-binding MarR family transcriptional regulator
MNNSDLVDRLVKNFEYVFLFEKKMAKLQKEVFSKHVTKSHIDVLIFLKTEGRSTMSQICEGIIISNPNLTPLIDKLVELQYVERSHDTNDRRIVTIDLTKSGKIFLEKEKSALDKNLKEIIKKFPPTKLETMKNILENVKIFVEME